MAVGSDLNITKEKQKKIKSAKDKYNNLNISIKLL